MDRVDHFIGDKSEAALLTEWFNVALLLNLGEDSDIGVDVYKGSDAGMRGLTLQFRFLVQSFSNVFCMLLRFALIVYMFHVYGFDLFQGIPSLTISSCILYIFGH